MAGIGLWELGLGRGNRHYSAQRRRNWVSNGDSDTDLRPSRSLSNFGRPPLGLRARVCDPPDRPSIDLCESWAPKRAHDPVHQLPSKYEHCEADSGNRVSGDASSGLRSGPFSRRPRSMTYRDAPELTPGCHRASFGRSHETPESRQAGAPPPPFKADFGEFFESSDKVGQRV